MDSLQYLNDLQNTLCTALRDKLSPDEIFTIAQKIAQIIQEQKLLDYDEYPKGIKLRRHGYDNLTEAHKKVIQEDYELNLWLKHLTSLCKESRNAIDSTYATLHLTEDSKNRYEISCLIITEIEYLRDRLKKLIQTRTVWREQLELYGQSVLFPLRSRYKEYIRGYQDCWRPRADW